MYRGAKKSGYLYVWMEAFELGWEHLYQLMLVVVTLAVAVNSSCHASFGHYPLTRNGQYYAVNILGAMGCTPISIGVLVISG